ncbi:MAG: histidine kinase [Chitinophagaceae bacterium]|nr:histidine kinase [Chitinophagaceae bacterium]
MAREAGGIGGMARAHSLDSKGFLWLIAINKVERFDGVQLREYFIEGGQQALYGIAADKHDVIWVTDRHQLFYLDPLTDRFKKYSDSTRPVGAYVNVIRDDAGDVFLVCRSGLMKLDHRQHRFKVVQSWSSAILGSSYFPMATHQQFLFFTNSKHVFRLHTKSYRLDSVYLPDIRTIIPVSADSILAGNTDLRSSWVSFGRGTVQLFTMRQRGSTISAPAYVSGGCAWQDGWQLLAVQHVGFFLYRVGHTVLLPATLFAADERLRSGLSLQNPYGVSITSDGLIYATDALYALSRQRTSFDVWPTARDLAAIPDSVSTEIRAVAEWPAGTYWLATLNGLLRWQQRKEELQVFFARPGTSQALSFPSIRGLAVSQNKLLVAQSQGGVHIVDASGKHFLPLRYTSGQVKTELEADFIAGLTTVANGKVLVAANKAAYQIDPLSREVQKIVFGKGPAPVYNRNIVQDALKRLWWVGSRGLVLTDSNYTVMASLQDARMKPVYFSTVVSVDDSVAWLAGEGLFEVRLMPNAVLRWQPIFTQLPRQLFYQLYRDDAGQIWAAGDKGIYRMAPDQSGFTLFSSSDNVPIQQFHRTSVLRATDGQLFFPGFSGVCFVNPADLKVDNKPLYPVITLVRLNDNDTCCWQNGFQLPYKTRSIEIGFVAPFLFGAEKIRYRYKLNEQDAKWHDASNSNSIRLANLAPGNYRFMLAASVNGKDWFEASSDFRFEILQPFWWRWWFTLPVILLVLALIWTYTKWRERQTIQRQANAMEMERIRNASLQYELEMAQVVNFFGTTISAQYTVDELLWAVAKGCISKMGFEDCVIYLVDETGTMLVQKAAWGPKSQEGNSILNAIEIPVGKGIVGSVAASGKPELIADTSADSRYIQDDAMRLSELAVPIMLEGRVAGVIDSEHPQADFYTQRHLQILTTVAALCAERMAKIAAEAAARKKEMEVLQLNQNLAIWQLASLRAQMNPHFLFNVMNSIQQFTLRHDFENANKYMTRFSKLLRKVLDSAVHEFVSLEEEIEHLYLYLEVEQLRMGPELVFEIHLHEELEPDAIRIPGMLVQPFVENALKHGLASVSGSKLIKVNFDSHTEQVIKVTIEDNGIGRERAAVLQQRQQHFLPHQSRGMALVAERLELLNAEGDLPPYSIDDIRSEDGSVAGTRVLLYLPVLGFGHE